MIYVYRVYLTRLSTARHIVVRRWLEENDSDAGIVAYQKLRVAADVDIISDDVFTIRQFMNNIINFSWAPHTEVETLFA